MIGYSELGILFLLLLAGGKKKEGARGSQDEPPGREGHAGGRDRASAA